MREKVITNAATMCAAFVIVALSFPVPNAAAQTTTERAADTIADESYRIADRSRTIFNVWASDRHDGIEALLLRRACGDHHYRFAWATSTAAQRELSREDVRQADRALIDMHQALRAHAMDETRDEGVMTAALIANGAVVAFRAYQLGFEAGLQRSWYADPSSFARDCART